LFKADLKRAKRFEPNLLKILTNAADREFNGPTVRRSGLARGLSSPGRSEKARFLTVSVAAS